MQGALSLRPVGAVRLKQRSSTGCATLRIASPVATFRRPSGATTNPQIGPGGAADCSHGWSAAKPVVSGVFFNSASAGQRSFMVEHSVMRSRPMND
jgi:hypothetical protein